MKLLAWLCIAWRPSVSSRLTHISLMDQPSDSPNSSVPNSASLGVTACAAATSRRLSCGFNIAVWLRFGEELLSRSASVLKCSTKPVTRSPGSARGTRMKGTGKRPKISAFIAGIMRTGWRQTIHQVVTSIRY